MKLAYLTTKFFPIVGGGETHTWLIASQMSSRGHTVDIITAPHPQRQADKSYNIHEVDGFSDDGVNFRAVAHISRLLELSNYDVVHIINYESLFTYNLLQAAVSGNRCVFSTANTPVIGARIFGGISGFEAEKHAVQHILSTVKLDRVIANSKTFFEGYKDVDIPSEKIQLVPFGVDLKSFVPTPKKQTSDQIRLLCTSRFINRKGIEHLIKSLDYLPSNFQLYLTGSGSVHDPVAHRNLLDLAKPYGVRVFQSERSVSQDEIAQLYRSADVFVMPSQYEGFGLASLEAMACGIPVVATNVQGLKEFIEHRKTGLLVDYGSPKQIAEAIISLIDDASLRNNLIKNSLDMVKQKYDAQNMADVYEKLYQEVSCGQC